LIFVVWTRFLISSFLTTFEEELIRVIVSTLLSGDCLPFCGLWPVSSQFGQACGDSANCVYYFNLTSDGEFISTNTLKEEPQGIFELYTAGPIKKDQELVWSRHSKLFGIEDDTELRLNLYELGVKCHCVNCIKGFSCHLELRRLKIA